MKKKDRPSLKQTLKLSEGEIEHVLNGGLLLEKNQKRWTRKLF